MALHFPLPLVESVQYIKQVLKQHHVDIQRFQGRQFPPSTATAAQSPGGTVSVPTGGGGGGGGSTNRKLGRISGNVAGGATATVTICDDDWATTIDTQSSKNGFPYYLLNKTGGTKVIIEQAGTTWWIVWCEHGPQYRGTIAGALNKGSSGTVTLLEPGTETSAGVTVSAVNRYANLTVSSGTKKVGVIHDGSTYCLDAAEC